MENFKKVDLYDIIDELTRAQKKGQTIQRRLEAQINPKSLEQEHIDWLLYQRDYLGNLDIVTMEADKAVRDEAKPEITTATIAETLAAWEDILQVQRGLLSTVDSQLNILAETEEYPTDLPFNQGHARRMQMSVEELITSNIAEQRQTSSYKKGLSLLKTQNVSDSNEDAADTESDSQSNSGIKGFFGKLFGK